MLEEGWIEETKTLMSKGLFETPTARQALGYQEIADFLNNKIISRDELIDKIVVKTSRYAKKQRTWFRNQHKEATLINPDTYNYKQITEIILNESQI